MQRQAAFLFWSNWVSAGTCLLTTPCTSPERRGEGAGQVKSERERERERERQADRETEREGGEAEAGRARERESVVRDSLALQLHIEARLPEGNSSAGCIAPHVLGPWLV